MRYALLAALALAGCSTSDLCYGEKGACIGLHLDGDSDLTQIDQVRVGVRLADGSLRYLTTPQPPAASSFPITTIVTFGDAAGSGESLLTVQGLRNGAVVAGADANVSIVPGKHSELTVKLVSPDTDKRCPATSLACEAFETSASTLEGPLSNDNPLTVDAVGDQVFDGTQSLRVSETGSAGSSYFGYVPQNQLPTLALRTYIYTDRALADQTYLFNFEIGSGQVALGAVASGTASVWGAFTSGPSSSPPSSVVLESGRWMCVEVVLDMHPTVRTATLYATDAFAPDLSATPVEIVKLPNGVLDDVEIGMFASASATQKIWYDDLAIGPDRIGCE